MGGKWAGLAVSFPQLKVDLLGLSLLVEMSPQLAKCRFGFLVVPCTVQHMTMVPDHLPLVPVPG